MLFAGYFDDPSALQRLRALAVEAHLEIVRLQVTCHKDWYSS